jgi:hypothetical protein
VLAIFDCTYVLGGAQVLIADTPARALGEPAVHRVLLRHCPKTPQTPK